MAIERDIRRDRFGVLTLATALALVLSGCQGDAAPEAGGSPSQAIPTNMLADGGTQQEFPAVEVGIDELGFNFGDSEAPIRIVEFSDFGCGFCKRFHVDIFPEIVTEFIDAGIVQWKYVPYVSGMFANGLPSAFAAECVGEQDRFVPMMNLLYERQADWKPLGDPAALFESYAVEVGAEVEEYRACLTEDRRRGRVRSGILTGARLGVRGTPSFLVDGYPLVGAQPIDVWRDIIQVRLDDLNNSEPG